MVRIFAATVGITLLTLGTAAYAETQAEQEARTLFREGNKRLEAQDFPAALELFRQAYERSPNPKILLNLGTTLRSLGREAEAADTYDRYLADPQADPKRRHEVEKLVREIDKRVGRVRIAVNEPGARVLLDGRSVGESRALLVVRADPGRRAVVAEKTGFRTAAATVAVAAGGEHSVDLKLEPAGAAPGGGVVSPEPGAGTLSITRRPKRADAEWWGRGFGGLLRTDVDGKFRGAAAVVGGYYAPLKFLEASVAAILGPNYGLYVGVTGLLPLGRWRPLAQLGLPLYFIDGARPGLHAALGLEWVAHRYLAFNVLVGVEHHFKLPANFEKTIFVPSLGLLVRL
jgi:hypothetical protein